MAKNLRGNGERAKVTVTADRASGDFVTEDGFHGTCCSDIANGERGLLDISQTEIEVDDPDAGTTAVGDAIFMSDATTLTRTEGTNRFVGKVTDLPGTNAAVPTGKMRMVVMPQAI